MNDKATLDIIQEVMNIGVGDAASALSSLLNSRVTIQVPDVYILDTKEAPGFVQKEIQSLGVYIAQNFTGNFMGKALLFYTRDSCESLLEAILGKSLPTGSFSEPAMAALQEIGNIIMVSCVTTITNMLKDTVSFEVPEVTFEISEGYFLNLVKDMGDLDKTILVRNRMVVKEKNIEGYIFIMIAFNRFLGLIDRMQANLLDRGDGNDD